MAMMARSASLFALLMLVGCPGSGESAIDDIEMGGEEQVAALESAPIVAEAAKQCSGQSTGEWSVVNSCAHGSNNHCMTWNNSSDALYYVSCTALTREQAP